jgi:hypothetical protein
MTIMSDLLGLLNTVSMSLQCKPLHIAAAAIQVEALIANIAERRNEDTFDKYWQQVTTMAES